MGPLPGRRSALYECNSLVFYETYIFSSNFACRQSLGASRWDKVAVCNLSHNFALKPAFSNKSCPILAFLGIKKFSSKDERIHSYRPRSCSILKWIEMIIEANVTLSQQTISTFFFIKTVWYLVNQAKSNIDIYANNSLFDVMWCST